jgi:erythromycin esterase-like protein
VLQRQVRPLGTYYVASGKATATTKQGLLRLTDELVQHLQAVAAPAAMQQHGQVLQQRASKMDFGERDQTMAANVARVIRQEPAAKVVVWAHNQHIWRDEEQLRMGQQLGPAYVALGFSTGHGTASVFAPDGSARALVLAPPLPALTLPAMALDQLAGLGNLVQLLKRRSI